MTCAGSSDDASAETGTRVEHKLITDSLHAHHAVWICCCCLWNMLMRANLWRGNQVQQSYRRDCLFDILWSANDQPVVGCSGKLDHGWTRWDGPCNSELASLQIHVRVSNTPWLARLTSWNQKRGMWVNGHVETGSHYTPTWAWINIALPYGLHMHSLLRWTIHKWSLALIIKTYLRLCLEIFIIDLLLHISWYQLFWTSCYQLLALTLGKHKVYILWCIERSVKEAHWIVLWWFADLLPQNITPVSIHAVKDVFGKEW